MTDFFISSKTIDSILEFFGKYYIMAIILFHALYIMIFLGVLSINAQYINLLNTFIQLFIGTFLIWRFNPFRTHELRQYDAKIIFGSGIFLLTNLGLFEFFKHFFQIGWKTM